MKQILKGSQYITSAEKNNLAVVSLDLNLAEFIEGVKMNNLKPDLLRLLNTSTAGHDLDIVLWNAGCNRMIVLDTTKKEMEELPLRIPEDDELFAGLSSWGGRRMMFASRAALTNTFTLTYCEKSSHVHYTVKKKPLEALCSDGKYHPFLTSSS